MQKLISFMRRNPHDPILIGNYSANMSVGYFPREEVEKFLPRAMSIPSDPDGSPVLTITRAIQEDE